MNWKVHNKDSAFLGKPYVGLVVYAGSSKERHTGWMQILHTGWKALAITGLFLVSQMLTGCAATSAFMADSMPTWAGGLPADAPPRPSDPRYPEYERDQRAKTVAVVTDEAKLAPVK